MRYYSTRRRILDRRKLFTYKEALFIEKTQERVAPIKSLHLSSRGACELV